MSDGIYSVSQLNSKVKSFLENNPELRNITLRGEISGFKRNAISGHCYFTLKDSLAAVNCTMWKGRAAGLRFEPSEGDSVICTGRVSMYEKSGSYQFVADTMQLDGQGDLHQQFLALLEKLVREGLVLEEEGRYCKAGARPLPPIPKRIGVITSGTGAAVRDVIRILGKRWPMSKVLVLPVRVQGEEAPREIASAIRYANAHDLADVLIVGRGGGSVEDLWCFNDEALAHVIFESRIPVISAVGHEPDFTISDFVADRRAATPSNGAELAVPDQAAVLDALSSLRARQYQMMRKRLDALSSRLKDLSERNVMVRPESIYQMHHLTVDRLSEQLAAAERQILSDKKQLFGSLAVSLDAMSPLKVLARGYSVATAPDGTALTDAAAVTPGDQINVRLRKGLLQCTVDNKLEDAL